MGCRPAQAQKPAQGRVIILGFDGVEPSVVDTMLEAGELPNLAKLRDQGVYSRLQSTIPPQSPTAWTTFATGKNPGSHGIYDFIRREPRRYLPDIGTERTDHPEFAADGSVTKPASVQAHRQGKTFWSIADQQGLQCKILNVPFVFPPDNLENGLMISGLGVPDIRTTAGMCFSLSDAYTEEKRLSGVTRLPLKFEDDKAVIQIPGARDTRNDYEAPNAYVPMPLTLTVNRSAHRVAVEFAGETLDLAQGQWSKWIRCAFLVTPEFTVHAITRMFVLEAGEKVQLYMACLQFDPKDPYVPFSHPEGYSGELEDRYGLYKTIGWAFDTHALRNDALTEDVFLEDALATMGWRERLTLDELDRGNFDLLTSVWTATDRVGHMFWRFRDPEHPLYTPEGDKKYGRALEQTYEKMDSIVGNVIPKLAENDLLLVISDHGFGTFHSGFNVNTWLVRNGYAVLKGQTDAATASGTKKWLQDFDWRRTKVYAIGLSSVYLNLKGREGRGIVDPAEAEALVAELRGKLLAVTHPDTGEKIFEEVYSTREVYTGAAAKDAPDIVLGYRRKYQSTKSTVSGSVPADLFKPCTDKWSGEHAANNMASMPGILFANRSLEPDPAIIDMARTVFDYLSLEPPADFEGKSVLLPDEPTAETP